VSDENVQSDIAYNSLKLYIIRLESTNTNLPQCI